MSLSIGSRTSRHPSQPVFYSLDNEVGLWGEALPAGWQSGDEPRPWENPPFPGVPPSSGGRTHPTIHPYAATFAELRDKTIAHAGAIKDVNPNAIVFGGVGYGWTDFTNLSGAPTRSPIHRIPGGDQTGEMHYHEWLLQQVRNAEIAQGRKLMDVLDLHWYTEVYADGQRITGDIATPAAVAARVQAPRSLWDPTYAEQSWISQWGTWVGSPGNYGPIKLLPRVQRDIDDFNPGTKIAITEYNYGGNNHISGAIAQADVLGIFGREGVFAANIWGGGSYINGAFDMYLELRRRRRLIRRYVDQRRHIEHRPVGRVRQRRFERPQPHGGRRDQSHRESASPLASPSRTTAFSITPRCTSSRAPAQTRKRRPTSSSTCSTPSNTRCRPTASPRWCSSPTASWAILTATERSTPPTTSSGASHSARPETPRPMPTKMTSSISTTTTSGETTLAPQRARLLILTSMAIPEPATPVLLLFAAATRLLPLRNRRKSQEPIFH